MNISVLFVLVEPFVLWFPQMMSESDKLHKLLFFSALTCILSRNEAKLIQSNLCDNVLLFDCEPVGCLLMDDKSVGKVLFSFNSGVKNL